MVAVIAVAATVITAGAVAAALTPGLSLLGGISAAATGGLGAAIGATAGGAGALGLTGTLVVAGAAGGAVGSIASQGTLIAAGVQEKFNWKSVGLAAIGGGVSGGLGSLANGSGFVADALSYGIVRGAVSSVVTQGIGTITGLQDSFDWTGVAASAISADIGQGVGSIVGDGFAGSLVTGAASAIANAATRSAIDGDSFGDNLRAAIPDVIGQAVIGAIGKWGAAAAQPKIPDTDINPVIDGAKIGPVVIDPKTGYAVQQEGYSIYDPKNDIDEVVAIAQRQANATFYDVVLGANAQTARNQAALQSGRAQQTLNQSYRLGVSGHNAAQDQIQAYNDFRARGKFAGLFENYDGLQWLTINHNYLSGNSGNNFGGLGNESLSKGITLSDVSKAVGATKGALTGIVRASETNTRAQIKAIDQDRVRVLRQLSSGQGIDDHRLDNTDYTKIGSKAANVAKKVIAPVGRVLSVVSGFGEIADRTKAGENGYYVTAEVVVGKTFGIFGAIGGGFVGAIGGTLGGLITGPGAIVTGAAGGAAGAYAGGEIGDKLGRGLVRLPERILVGLHNEMNNHYTGYWGG